MRIEYKLIQEEDNKQTGVRQSLWYTTAPNNNYHFGIYKSQITIFKSVDFVLQIDIFYFREQNKSRREEATRRRSNTSNKNEEQT